MFKGARKEDLKLIASELNIKVQEKDTVFEMIELIKNSDQYIKDAESVKEMANLIIEERKSQDKSQIEIEKLRLERSKIELELARVRAETKDISCEGESQKQDSIDSLIKNIRTLTVKTPPLKKVLRFS